MLPVRCPGLVRTARSKTLSLGHGGLPGDTHSGCVRADAHTVIVVDAFTDTFADPHAQPVPVDRLDDPG